VTSWQVIEGDCREALLNLPAQSVQTCVTSPPYFGLRDYGHAGQIGLERTPDEFVEALVGVFRDVRRVLRDDGTLWLNLGDSYSSSPPGNKGTGLERLPGVKPKDLLGIPWMVAFALRADGWYLRSDIIWSKPNPMPESVTDRPTKAHEYVFLLSKSARYFYDADAIREDLADCNAQRTTDHYDTAGRYGAGNGGNGGLDSLAARMRDGNHAGRNKRSVWEIATQPFPGAHFATFPPKLIEPCILAGSRPGDTVLDPFSGAGTTGLVALRRDRSYIGIELNSEYAEMSRWRLRDDAPLLNVGTEAA
jgi:DNA modification methylase